MKTHARYGDFKILRAHTTLERGDENDKLHVQGVIECLGLLSAREWTEIVHSELKWGSGGPCSIKSWFVSSTYTPKSIKGGKPRLGTFESLCGYYEKSDSGSDSE